MEYFVTDINMVIINYLDNDNESLQLLEVLKINEKYYTSKEYHNMKYIDKTKYKINKIIVNDWGGLYEFNDLEDKRNKKYKNYTSYSTNRPPDKITHLEFGRYFNRKVDNLLLPEYLTHLKFGAYFNRTVDKLPKNIIYLKFGHSFNQKIDNLPEEIEYLTLGYCFNKNVNLEKYKKIKKIEFLNEEIGEINVKKKKLFTNKPAGCTIIITNIFPIKKRTK